MHILERLIKILDIPRGIYSDCREGNTKLTSLRDVSLVQDSELHPVNTALGRTVWIPDSHLEGTRPWS